MISKQARLAALGALMAAATATEAAPPPPAPPPASQRVAPMAPAAVADQVTAKAVVPAPKTVLGDETLPKPVA